MAHFGKMIKVQLPFEKDYCEFVNKHPLKNRRCVYKLSFSDGAFYIGQSGNFAGRIWTHCMFNDLKEGSLPTLKHIRMQKAISKKETVTFKILSDEQQDEAKFIKASFSDKRCLNMRSPKC